MTPNFVFIRLGIFQANQKPFRHHAIAYMTSICHHLKILSLDSDTRPWTCTNKQLSTCSEVISNSPHESSLTLDILSFHISFRVNQQLCTFVLIIRDSPNQCSSTIVTPDLNICIEIDQ